MNRCCWDERINVNPSASVIGNEHLLGREEERGEAVTGADHSVGAPLDLGRVPPSVWGGDDEFNMLALTMN